MSISFTKYIDITSVVGGAAQVPQRQFCGRVFTINPLVPPNAVFQFSSQDASDVGAYFGTNSEEYARALAYMSYLSVLGTRPTAIQFARFVKTDQPATIFGESGVAVVNTVKAITSGKLSFKFGASQVDISGVNFSSVTTFTDIATALQTAIRAGTGAPNGELTTATVTWNASTQSFQFAASSTGVVTEKFQVVAPSGVIPATDIAAAIGWYASQGATVGDAQALETAVSGFSRVVNLNNNFGSFVYTDAAALALADAVSIATANAALNVAFQFRVPVTPSGTFAYATASAALIGIAGTSLEYEDVVATGARQYPEMLPMSIQGAINFNAVNGAVGFMYKQNGIYSPSVMDTPLSDTLDAARVNYIGQTQQNGANVSFYQTGVLCGGATAPLDMTVFANEQWFKDHIGTQLINLQLSVGQIPANKRGQVMCENVINGQAPSIANGNVASGIQLAVLNGTISVNSTLTLVQQIYITQQTNDSTAWQQVQNIGYWLATNITSAVVGGVTVYTLNYTLIYRKDDVIKKIVGSHQLI